MSDRRRATKRDNAIGNSQTQNANDDDNQDMNDGDYIPPSQCTQSQVVPVSQSQRGTSVLTSVEKTSLLKQLTTYLLLTDRSYAPIKRDNVVKYILKDYRREYVPLMDAACRTLSSFYNYKPVYLDEQKKDKLVLHACVKSDPFMHTLLGGREKSLRVVLLLALAIIDKSVDKVLSGEDILRFFVMCGICDADHYKHAELGDVRKLLFEEFVRYGYLGISRRHQQSNLDTEYKWGTRAVLECSPQFVEAFVNKMSKPPVADDVNV